MTSLLKNRKFTDNIPMLLIGLGVLAVLVYSFSAGISGNDFWWHIKVGEYVVENGTVPTTDIFSWAGMEKNISWTAHEWLCDVFYYVVYSAFGSLGVFLFCLLSAMAMIGLIWWQCWEFAKKNILFFGLYILLFSVLSGVLFYGRPHLFSFFFLFFTLKILFRFWDNNDSKSIYILPFLSILWSNVHGGAANLAYLLPLVFLIVGILKFDCGRLTAPRLSKKGLLILGAVTVACLLGILVNPVGLQVFIYPYTSFGDNLSMTIISEWASPDAKSIGQLILYFFPIVMMTVGIVTDERKVRLIDLAVMGVFLFLFFRSVRFIMFWFIAAAFYAIRYVPELKTTSIRKWWEIFVCVFLVVVLTVLIGGEVKDTVSTAQDGKLISVAMSDEAVAFIKEENPKRIFNDYNVGETLIYNDIPTFIDARADLFAQENLLADAVSLMYLDQANTEAETAYVDVDALIQKYEFDGFLILNSRPLYAYLISHPEQFECAYEDETVTYFRVIGETRGEA